mmetsp:Transcript_7057/g.17717  ORF Transcript_7057/g.17717 Transcript_7057/m.17717 type:complete len:345 (+) Transcript_7057:98-1132(+)|eukprot:CAMPEP_0172396424 /NCGR_PEP_ID=MMETSP1061-20121228/24932_1 /TAXON_ID=37318 /ORGANISM="Pseudo-nitzschia pungens, Strain cf. pungens" /LENGTH=344 /DNA_ID=CAMNT_0013128249 /DNA_START=24 /DNA_END=1058 /DNA_ORIENTATION=-
MMIAQSSYLCLVVAALAHSANAFAPSALQKSVVDRSHSSLSSAVYLSSNDDVVGRRDAFAQAAQLVAGVALTSAATTVPMAFADEEVAAAPAANKVVVAGATGQTGRRVLERLANAGNLQVVGGVRNVEKATASLGESSTVVRGAMIQKVASVDTSAVALKHLDVVKDSVDELAATMAGAESLVIATGFIPGNPLKMNAAAHEVDNVGTIKLIDAAKKTGTVKKIVMVSSILTNGRNWGQEKSPGFVITNAFGNVLDEKLVAENYLKSSGLDYTIVRPGGLKAKPPTGALMISGEDTLNSGEISRDLVADVCVASLTDSKAANKVLEIIEDEGTPPKVFNGLVM